VTNAQSNGATESLETRVRNAIEQIRPAVRADGGDVELIDVADNRVRVRFRGACVGCPSSGLTLQMGIERAVKMVAPEIESVVAVP
jgi:Fe-S cluster biogenesis protein NfuA